MSYLGRDLACDPDREAASSACSRGRDDRLHRKRRAQADKQASADGAVSCVITR